MAPIPQLQSLATLQPPCNARTWLSTPHPHLPIIATACSDKTVRIYSLQNFQQQATISGGHKRSIRSCCWKPNSVGESVLATGSFDASAGIWKRWEENAGAGGGKGEVDFTGGLAGGDRDADGEDDEWRLEVILDGHDSEIKSLQFCPTAPLLATCSRDKSVWIWEELDDGENFETMAVLQDHEGDVKSVGWHPAEQLLASGSYDDTVRLWREDMDDWACCALLKGHSGTVWWVEFEGVEVVGSLVKGDGELKEEQKAWLEEREKSGPRLMTCSDDKTIRVWRRKPREKKEGPGQQAGMPSIWKNRDFEEEWYEEAQLPPCHDRPIYTVNWSRETGRVASTGSDGKIVVYKEVWRRQDVEMTDATAVTNGSAGSGKNLTEWIAIADVENAHDVFEVNHVVWAPRCDRGKLHEQEEVVVSTGDDGEVKVWTLD